MAADNKVAVMDDDLANACARYELAADSLADEIDRMAELVSVCETPHRKIDLSLPDLRCGSCVSSVEKKLLTLNNVHSARVNLARKQLTICWNANDSSRLWLSALRQTGQGVMLPGTRASHQQTTQTALNSYFRALAVSGFAAANIMMLSVGVWSGADESMRQWLHIVSGVIAIPAVLYSGKHFFQSAWQAIRVRTVNMDVPISIGIGAVVLLGIFDTWVNSEHVYFESAVMLIFFLLLGRTLEQYMRNRAIRLVGALERFTPSGAYKLQETGDFEFVTVDELLPGDTVRVPADQIIPVDGLVTEGQSTVDSSVMTGESEPVTVAPGSIVSAGTRNIDGVVQVRVQSAGSSTNLARMVKHVNHHQLSSTLSLPLADQASRYYAPFVHLMALVSGMAWLFISGDWHTAITVAVAVLIITCPCAFGLAIPMVQTITSQRMFEKGILLLTSDSLEKIPLITRVVFDKTGTLTRTSVRLLSAIEVLDGNLDAGGQKVSYATILRTLAAQSGHPYAAAALTHMDNLQTPAISNSSVHLSDVRELSGNGIQAKFQGQDIRLGKPGWAGSSDFTESSLVFSVNGKVFAEFAPVEVLAQDSEKAFTMLSRIGIAVEILSGDRRSAVAKVAGKLGVKNYAAQLEPLQKADRIADLQTDENRILFIGDGINDLPALAASEVAMVPGTAADIDREVADIVYTGNSLCAVPDVISLGRHAYRLMKQNLWLSCGYNILAIPAAACGLITPLWAALAMSGSSLLVIANSMRVRYYQIPGSDKQREMPLRNVAVPVHSNG